MKRILLSASICFFAIAAFGQIKNVKAAYKAASLEKPDFAEAAAQIKPALESSETKGLAETWWTAGYIEDRKFDAEKMKLLIGQPANEAVMYPALLLCFEYWVKAIGLDALPNEKGKVKPKYTKKIKETLQANHQYLINGGAAAFDKNDHKLAYQYFNEYVLAADNPDIFENMKWENDSNYLMIKFFRAVAASQMEDHELAIKAYEELKGGTYKTNEVYQYLCFELEKIKDTARLETTLQEGITKFPNEQYYIQSLINMYIFSGRTDKAITYIETALQQTPQNAQLWNVKGTLFEERKEVDKAKECFEKALSIEPENVDILTNMGRYYYNQAVKMNDEISNIKDQKEYKAALTGVNDVYKQALPFFEKAHQVKPEEREVLVALRGIYYKLNMGKEYEETEAKLNK